MKKNFWPLWQGIHEDKWSRKQETTCIFCCKISWHSQQFHIFVKEITKQGCKLYLHMYCRSIYTPYKQGRNLEYDSKSLMIKEKNNQKFRFITVWIQTINHLTFVCTIFGGTAERGSFYQQKYLHFAPPPPKENKMLEKPAGVIK